MGVRSFGVFPVFAQGQRHQLMPVKKISQDNNNMTDREREEYLQSFQGEQLLCERSLQLP